MSLDLADEKHVFADWRLIEPGYGVGREGPPTSWELPHGVRLAVHPPRVDLTPLVAAEHPWESFINVYCTMFEDDGRFRLYYECHDHRPQTEPKDLAAMIAYAESTDGTTWGKPVVGSVDVHGSTRNNLVYGRDVALGRGAHGATIFKDPSGSSDERYKLVHAGLFEGAPCVYGAVSPDGLRWRAIEKPLLANYLSDTQTVVRFDEQRGCYVGYFRGWRGDERGAWRGRRVISYAETRDFRAWPVPQPIVEPDAADSPSADIYTNSYTPWPGAADAHLMFPAFYQRASDTLEVHMLTSRDGLHWERPTRTPIIAFGEPQTNREGGVYAGCGLAELTPGEWSLPIAPKWHTHNQGRHTQGRLAHPPDNGYICRACWRQDGLMSLEAETEGACTTAPITFSGSRLVLNAWTRFAGEIRVELADATGRVVAGRSFAVCDPFSGDNLRHTVTWRGASDLSAWAGQDMRLRFRLRRGRLYALQFV